MSYQVLKDQAEELVNVWRGIVLSHARLRAYDENPHTGELDKGYAAAVGKRFAQWVIDTARADDNQQWLDQNKTDGAHTADHIRGRDLIAFAAAIVAPMKPYLSRGGQPSELVNRMYDATGVNQCSPFASAT